MIVDNFFGVGGTETNTHYLTDSLHALECDLCVVTTWKCSSKEVYPIYGIASRADQSIYSKSQEFLSKIFLPQIAKMFILFMLTLFVTIKKRVDVIHVHMALPTGFPAILVGTLLRKPVVLSVRGSDLNVFATKRFLKEITVFTLQRADAIVALSQGLKKLVINLGISNNKVFVVPNGVDLSLFDASNHGEKYHSKVCDSREKIVLFVGTIQTYRRKIKGLDYLLLAMKDVITKVPDARLVAVGVPELPDLVSILLKLGIKDRVTLVGVVPHQEIRSYYFSCDVFVLPSLKEGLPTTVLEAMASAKPVVASDIEGCRDLIENGVNGFLVAPRQPNGIADRIIKIVTNPEFALQMGQQGRTIAKERYSWVNIAKKTLNIYLLVGKTHND